MRRAARTLTSLFLAATAASASSARAEESNEFWPEAQIHYWFDDRKSRAILMGSLSRNRASDTTYQAEQGLTFEHQFADYFLGRIGYRHGASTEGCAYNENRLLLEQTFRLYLPDKVIVDARTREDFRWLDSGFAVRLRERLQVQRDFTIDNYTFTPYTSAEVFFDTRYGQFARYRLTLGVTLPINKHISVEPYLVRQVDWAPSGVITNALGFILIMAF